MSQKYLDYVQFKNENLKVRDTEARTLIQDNANDIASLKPRMDSAEREIAGLKDRVTVTEQDIDMLEGRMSIVETKNNEQDAEINAIEAEQTEQNSRLSAVEAKNKQQDTRLTSLENNQTTIFNDIRDINIKDDEQDGDLAQLDSRMHTAEDEIVTINNTITNINNTVDEIIDKNNEQDAQIEDLDRRIVASTYEAGEGIYFGQGVDHTNINVEDELLDEIHASTAKNIEQDGRLDDIEADAVYGVKVVTGDTKKIKIVGKTDDVKNVINGTVTSTPSGSVSKPTFTGTQSTISVSGTPSGSVSQPTFTGDAVSISGTVTPTGNVSGTGVSLGTKSISEITSVGTLPSKAADTYVAPSASYDSSTETITFTPGSFSEGAFSAGTLPTSSSTTVADGSATVTDPIFTGDQVSISGTVTPTGTVSQPTFTGTQMTSTGTYTPTGSVSQPTFTGTEATADVIFDDQSSIPTLTLVASPASTQNNPITKNIRYTQTQTLSETFTLTTNRANVAIFILHIETVDYGGPYPSYINISAQPPSRVDDTTSTIKINYKTLSSNVAIAGSYRTTKVTVETVDEFGQTATDAIYFKVIVTE